MTINTTANRKEYTGNGVTTDFSFPYYFLADADLVVIETVIATGVQTTKTLTTHYTVTGAGNPAGGTVTMLTAPASTVTLTIYRDPSAIQDVDLVEGDPLPVETAVEEPLDRLTMIVQRLKELIERALRLPEGDTGFVAADTLLPAETSRASKYLAFDADGKPTATAGTTSDLIATAFVETLLDDIDADTFVQTLVAALNAETAPATDDTVLLGDTSESKGNKITLENLLKVLNSLTEDTAPDSAADFLLSYDTSASAVKKVKPGKLGTFETLTAQGAAYLTGDISPSQITGNQNDYNPTGLSTASVLRLNSDASRSITGLAGGSDGRVVTVINTGSFSITLKDEDAASTAANRFALYRDIEILPDTSVTLWYDSTSSRWRANLIPRVLGATDTTTYPNIGTVYGPVSSDGFAMGSYTGAAANHGVIGYSDASNPPTTQLCVAYGSTGGKPVGVTIPVKKGHYFLFQNYDDANTTGSVVWVPLV